MNVCFIDKTNFIYNSRNLYSQNLRGEESILINFSNALNSLRHKLTIINNCRKSKIINDVKWFPPNNFEYCFLKKKFNQSLKKLEKRI